MRKMIIYLMMVVFLSVLSTSTCYEFVEAPEHSFEDYNEMKKEFLAYHNDKFYMELSTNKDVIELSKSLKKTAIEDTISNVEYWYDTNIEYSFFNSKHEIEWIIKNKMGDCTDKGEFLYQVLGLNGIKVRKVHGLKNSKHDWVEVLYPHDGWLYWKPIEKGFEKQGEGFW